tara:strand:- start:891 stop:1016 length:126 start_codon:yes stop_codon:yes gene_type:complete
MIDDVWLIMERGNRELRRANAPILKTASVLRRSSTAGYIKP